MLGTINEFRILNKVEAKISNSANANWQKTCKEEHENKDDYSSLQKIMDEKKDKYIKIIDYNNQQLTENILPSYHHMVSIFKEYYYLADHNTCKYFYPLIEYVNLWDRWLKKTIPAEVITDLEHGERALLPFYKEIEEIHDRLRKMLANGKA